MRSIPRHQRRPLTMRGCRSSLLMRFEVTKIAPGTPTSSGGPGSFTRLSSGSAWRGTRDEPVAPTVELIQLGARYPVRDGDRRIPVARGGAHVDAVVTVQD